MVLDWLLGLSIPEKCSREEYEAMSDGERAELHENFFGFLQDYYPDKRFGYNTFKELEYDQFVISMIYIDLKKSGKIRPDGYLYYRLT